MPAQMPFVHFPAETSINGCLRANSVALRTRKFQSLCVIHRVPGAAADDAQTMLLCFCNFSIEFLCGLHVILFGA